jgi:putative spermidine/putrescine transport system substrate-binding protein
VTFTRFLPVCLALFALFTVTPLFAQAAPQTEDNPPLAQPAPQDQPSADPQADAPASGEANVPADAQPAAPNDTGAQGAGADSQTPPDALQPSATEETPSAPPTPSISEQAPAPTPPAEQTPAPAAAPEIPEPAPAPAPAVAPETPAPALQPAAAPPVDPKDVKLQIASAGGAYMKSQEMAYFRPFGRRTGYSVSTASFDGTLDSLKAQGASSHWDVADLDQDVVAQACQQGLLEPLDAALLQPGPDGTSPSEDFVPGAIQPCGIASTAWSAVIVYEKGLKAQPSKAENFFDLKKFPGKRALPRTPQHTLELALLADGVAPGEIYAKLATREGQNRAFAKLSAIKEQIVWWDRAADATAKITSKQAAMGLAFNGRIFMTIVKNRQPLAILWDHQIYHLNYWAVPKGGKFPAQAREFIAFATSAGPLADQTRWMPYGPARLSAVKLAGRHAELNLDMKPYLPTYQPNLQGALAFDSAWWSQQQELKDRFAAWLEGRELPASATTAQ